MSGRYFEVVLAGHHEYIKGFVSGIIAGRGLSPECFFGEDYDLDEENVVEMLGRLIGIRDEHTVIVVESQVLNILKELLDSQKREGEMKLLSVREVGEASFTFSIHTYSREIGGKIDLILTEAAQAVNISPPYAPREKEIPEGKGIEAYAPLHDYEFRVKGKISGECAEVLRCYGRLKRFEVADLGSVEVTLEK